MTRPAVSTDPRAVYMREWRRKNIDRAREIELKSQAKRRSEDPEGFREAAHERYQKWLAKGDNADREKSRRRYGQPHYAGGKRRGLTMVVRHAYWEFQKGLCDFCAMPCPDPAQPGAWKMTVVDHDRDHCSNKIGCIDCVRGQGHRVCNVAEGVIQKAMRLGIITGVTGPLVQYLADPPFQQWRLTSLG